MEEKYLGFIIRKSEVDNMYYAYNPKTGDRKGGSSKTYLDKSIDNIKKRIKASHNKDSANKCANCETWRKFGLRILKELTEIEKILETSHKEDK